MTVVRDVAPRAALVVMVASCAGGNAASMLGGAPAFDPKGQSKCSVAGSHAKPLIVEWPSADRAEIEAHARRGLVAVRYEGCHMEVLDQCTVPGTYRYAGLTRKDEIVTMRDADDLYANIPVHAASFEATLQKSGELNVTMSIVGRYVADRPNVRLDELQGDCSRATHVVAALTAGAFELSAGSDATIGGGARVWDAGVGAGSRAKRETLNRDGDKVACEKARTDDDRPPEGCGALLRVDVVPLIGDRAGLVPMGTCGHLPSAGAKPSFRLVTSSTAKPRIATSYPVFTLDCDRASTAMNGAIERDVQTRVAQFRELTANIAGDAPFDEVTCAPTTTWPSVVSVACQEDVHTGGAHPMHQELAFTFAIDGPHARMLTLDDVILSEQRRQLVKRVTLAVNLEKRKRGFGEPVDETTVEKAMSTFFLGDSDLVLVFDQYAVGSGVEGAYRVALPYASLGGILRPDGPVSKVPRP